MMNPFNFIYATSGSNKTRLFEYYSRQLKFRDLIVNVITVNVRKDTFIVRAMVTAVDTVSNEN